MDIGSGHHVAMCNRWPVDEINAWNLENILIRIDRNHPEAPMQIENQSI